MGDDDPSNISDLSNKGNENYEYVCVSVSGCHLEKTHNKGLGSRECVAVYGGQPVGVVA